MSEKVTVFQDPKNPKRIIVSSTRGYKSSFLIAENGRVMEETAAIRHVSRMGSIESFALDSHKQWAAIKAQKKADELALQGSLPL